MTHKNIGNCNFAIPPFSDCSKYYLQYQLVSLKIYNCLLPVISRNAIGKQTYPMNMFLLHMYGKSFILFFMNVTEKNKLVV